MQGCGRYVPLVLTVLILAAAGQAQAQAVAFDSTTGARQIKACVLLPSPWEWNSNPYLFTGLVRSGYCPPQWEFVNPLAQTEVTPEIQFRWLNAAHSDLGAGPMYWASRGFAMGNELGRTIPRDWPQYWEVPTARASELTGMDLIYVSVPILADTDPTWALGEAVLKAVEDGALLWIDQTTTMDGLTGAVPGVRAENPASSRPLPDLQLPPRTSIDPAATEKPRPFEFEAVASATGRAAADIIPLPTATLSSADILRKPYPLQTWDVATVGIQRAGAPAGDPALFQIKWPLMDATGTYPHRTEVDFTPLIRLMDGNTVLGPTAMVAPYGSGAILVTAGNVGHDIEAWAVGGGRPNRFQTPDIRFAVNALTWALDRRQDGSSGGRRASDHVRSPVQVRWQYPNPGRVSPADGTTDVPLGPVMAAPLHFNGRLYALANRDSSGTARLVCLDPNPEQDLCGGVGATDTGPDGSADDGIPDYGYGSEYDVIWEYALPAGLSPKSAAPVGAYLPQAASPAEATVPAIVLSASPVDASATADGLVLCINALTGAPVWTRPIRPYAAFNTAGLGVNQSAVCDVSTPAVSGGWVYVVASEYANGLVGPTTERVYGRAWCFDLTTGGAVVGDPTLGGALWVFPDCDQDRDGTVDAYPEPQKWLPAFNDPSWAADVGTGAASGLAPNPGGPVECPTMKTAAPIITSAQRQPQMDSAGTGWRPGLCDAMMLVGTALSVEWTGTGIFTNPLVGGSDVALAPTPRGGDGTGVLGAARENAQYYCVPLNTSQSAFTAAQVAGGALPLATPTDTAATTVAHFAEVNGAGTGVRQFLATWSATAAVEVDRMDLATGCDIELQYAAGGPYDVFRLPGPVAWCNHYPPGQIRLPGGALADSLLYTASVPPTVLDQPMSGSSISGGATVTGLITALDSVTGAIRWRLDPRVAAPSPPIAGDLGTQCQSLMSRPATADDGTLVAAVSHWPVGGPAAGSGQPSRNAVMGFRAGSDFEVHLGPTLDDAVGISRNLAAAPVVRLLETNAAVAPHGYEIDYDRRIVRFPARYAYDVPIVAPDPTAGPDSIAGKALLVTWEDTAGTTHSGTSGNGDLVVVSPAQNFAYVSGFVKLTRYPVPVGSVVVTAASGATGVTGGVVVSNVLPGEATVSYNYGSGATEVLPNGWLDLRAAYIDRNGNGSDDTASGIDLSVVGLDLQVTYTGYDRRAEGWTPPAALAAFDDVNGFISIPNPGLGLSAERTQVPVAFGPSLSGATVAGRTILVGTEGLDSQWTDAFQTPMGGVTPSDTLLTMNWEPSENRLTGRLVRPVSDNQGYVPAVTAPVDVSGDDAFVGVRTMSAPGTPTGQGYVSALSTERTLIAAGSRIVECVGSEPARTWEGYVDTDGTSRPFGQIAKAVRLPGGNILVVDSGLSVVVEIDGSGRQVWPTGGGAANARMLLSKPTDAWRYYTTTAAGLRLMHTVIADSGNFRIVEVVSWPTSLTDPTLSHSLYVVSPETVAGRQPGERVRVEYQKAQPILDPQTGQLWGYLASAANWSTPLIVEPPRWDAAGNYWGPRANFSPGLPSDPVPLGGRVGEVGMAATLTANATWMPWVSLANQQFTNIRQVEYVTYGGSGADAARAPFGAGSATYAWVVASSYAGASGLPMGVYEFDIANGGGLSYVFSRADFTSAATVAEENRGPIGLPSGSFLQKPFYPVSAKRLRSGDYLVANYSGLAENLSQANVGAAAIGRGLGSEVFTVTRFAIAPASRIYQRDTIPDPRRTEWPEPLSLVSYAERD